MRVKLLLIIVIACFLAMACATTRDTSGEAIHYQSSQYRQLSRGYHRATQSETVYREPDLGSQKLQRIDPGTMVEVVDVAGAFAQIKISENAVWVKRNQTEETNVPNVVRTLGTVRSKESPSDMAPDMDILESGRLLTVKTKSGQWLLVILSENRGWVLSGVLEPIASPTQTTIQPSREPTGRWIVVKRANFRNAPTTSSRILDTFEPGTRLDFLGRSGDWIKLQHLDIIGYIHEDLVAPEY